jgi:hypothetical protein
MFDELKKYARLGEFVFKHGHEGKEQPLPKGIRLAPMKSCFRSAQRLAVKRSLHYVEGFVAPDVTDESGKVLYETPMFIHHGWCEDDAGNVFDNVLRRPERAKYFGITIPASLIPLGKNWHVLLAEFGCINKPVWQHFDKE